MIVEEVWISWRSNKYTVSITAPDFWLTDTQLNITARITLTEKCAEPFEMKAYVEDRYNSWALRSDDANASWRGSSSYSCDDELPSTNARHSIILAEEGGFWENTIQWNIELPRGRSVTATLDFDLWLGEFPANATDPSVVPRGERYLINITDDGLSTPITIALFRPLLSPLRRLLQSELPRFQGWELPSLSFSGRRCSPWLTFSPVSLMTVLF